MARIDRRSFFYDHVQLYPSEGRNNALKIAGAVWVPLTAPVELCDLSVVCPMPCSCLTDAGGPFPSGGRTRRSSCAGLCWKISAWAFRASPLSTFRRSTVPTGLHRPRDSGTTAPDTRTSLRTAAGQRNCALRSSRCSRCEDSPGRKMTFDVDAPLNPNNQSTLRSGTSHI